MHLNDEEWPDKCDRCRALKLHLHKNSNVKTGPIRATVLSSGRMVIIYVADPLRALRRTPNMYKVAEV